MLDGSVNEFFEFGEGDDFVELAGDFGFGHAENGAGKKSVLAAGELRMEAGTDFEERADAAVDFRPANGGAGNARKYAHFKIQRSPRAARGRVLTAHLRCRISMSGRGGPAGARNRSTIAVREATSLRGPEQRPADPADGRSAARRLRGRREP